MVYKSQNNHQVKKIIDPKSGFSLYIRKFNDSNISQVSTDITFPIPNPDAPVNQKDELSDVSVAVKTLKKNNSDIVTNQNELKKLILKQNQQIKLLSLAVIISIMLVILF